VRNIGPGALDGYPEGYARIGDRFFFGADDGEHGAELWRSDGTRRGTKLVRNIAPGATDSNPFLFKRVGRRIFFSADDGTHGEEPWRTDGTRNGTKLAADIDPNPGDGSLEGSFSEPFGRLGRMVLMRADDGTNGVELWVIDGGQERQIEINPDANSFPAEFTTMNGFVLFTAYDGLANHGEELWRTDGTVAGTKLVRDIAPGSADSIPGRLVRVGDRLYLGARRTGGNDAELWRSKGTRRSTKLVKEFFPGAEGGFPKSGENVGGTFYFSARDDVFGAEPWIIRKPR
jgi:ELWxxDGT repeat protein